MQAAVIDIGSNTVQLLIGEEVDGEVVILESLKNVVDIGHNTFYKERISQEIINRLLGVLAKYRKVIEQYGITDVKVIATTAVREASNRNVFLDTIFRKSGYAVEVLNVGDVVYYIDSYLSHKLRKSYPINERNVVIAELGAGSLDISLMEKGYTLANVGIPIGTFRLKQFKEKIDASQSDTYEAISEFVENQIITLKKSFSGTSIDDVIVIDESYSTVLENIIPDINIKDNLFHIKLSEAQQFLSRVTTGNPDDIVDKYNLPSDISDTLDVYAVIINKLYKLIKRHSIYILQTSLSEAVLAYMLLDVEIAKKYNKANQLTSIAKFLCRKYQSHTKHTRQVAFLCEKLFKEFQEKLGLEDDDLLYLTLAAHLHDIGLFISNRAHHKHSEYIINALSLFRLKEYEIKIIACVARYHRKATPRNTHMSYGSLTSEHQILIQKLSSIMRMANALDSSHKQKVKDLEVTIDKKQDLKLTVYTVGNFILEATGFHDKKSLFEELSGMHLKLVVKKQV